MKNKIGLALGSGGPRGLTHIGVIKALIANNIPIDMIAGTSSGSIVGGLYLSLGSIEQVEDIFVKLSLSEMASILTDIGLKSGVIRGENGEKFIDKYINGSMIESLRLPFAAVTTDALTGMTTEITSGSLTKAIRASVSIPGLISLVNIKGQYLMDGGVSQPVPIRAAFNLGATKVIAVNLDFYNFVAKDFRAGQPRATTMGLAAIKSLRYHLAKEQCREADIVIEPDVSQVNWMSFPRKSDRIEIIQRGYAATVAKMDEIKRLLTI
jgi:NTE family protein